MAQVTEDYFDGLTRSFAVIVVSEIGDKTFLLAAIMAMRHPRLIILAGAFAALALMSLLSAVMGHILPALLPRRYTTVAAALLFFVFGAMMLREGLEMEGGNEKIQEEMREVQKEVEDAEEKVTGSGAQTSARLLENAEEGGAGVSASSSSAHARPLSANGSGMSSNSRQKNAQDKNVQQVKQGISNLVQLFVHPILLQTFVMTFLAEWGDRSQISTIALAAAHNVWIVTIGTIFGHLCCTAAAVMGGRWLATKISVKHVTLGGAVLFLIFGVAYLYEAYAWDEAADAAALAF